MISKPIALGLVAAACVAASAGGAYVAVRQNEPTPASPVATSEPTRTGKSEAAVAETEAVITPTPAVEAVAKSSASDAHPDRGREPHVYADREERKRERAGSPVCENQRVVSFVDPQRSGSRSSPGTSVGIARDTGRSARHSAPPPGPQRRRCQNRSLTCRPRRSRSSSRSSCRRRPSLDSTSRLRSRARRQRSKIASKRA